MKPILLLDNKPKAPSLVFCIIMDLIGYLSYIIPFLGEFADIVWAPISGIIFYQVFGGSKGMIGGFIAFLEEAFPGLDFIPTFTIMWFINRTKSDKAIQIKN